MLEFESQGNCDNKHFEQRWFRQRLGLGYEGFIRKGADVDGRPGSGHQKDWCTAFVA